ncbi:holo-ACP synthase [Paucilactobacillus nenjiangensis]|jgi:holo-[acyl-carrier protein] synthase|uniref:holo-ACP synthase n=1 Tax=Paucilactobacillus nenjiangensis TaxID=1296540 RepID=UPI0028D55BAB|nr:holo-ACP synthase [Paucilactobacillus nenjiangensis]
MIYGIGIDISEIQRVEQMKEKHANFISKTLTAAEHQQYLTRSAHKQAEYLAGRFSVKESFSKALGTGIGAAVGFQDLEVLDDESGKPTIKQSIFDGPVHVSISHTDSVVISEVILEEG